MKILTLAVVLVLGLLGLPAASYATDPGVLVQWPTQGKLNPSTTTYDFTVDDQDEDPATAGTLYAEWLGQRTEIPHDGEVSLTLQTDGSASVRVLRCSEGGACVEMSVSPELEARSSLTVALVRGSIGPNQGRVTAQVSPSVPDGTIQWQIAADATAEPIVSGESRFTSSYPTPFFFDVEVPADLAEGTYLLRTSFTADVEKFGVLHGTDQVRVTVDKTARATLSGSDPAIYPFHDHYRDETRFLLHVDERLRRARVEVFDLAGSRVNVLMDDQIVAQDRTLLWKGRDARGQILPDGTYVVRAAGIDTLDNPLDVSTTIRVSGKRLVMTKWKRTFPAAATISDTFVGDCSTLAKPSSHGWAGSLGYYSQTHCTRPRQSPVITLNGVYLPTSFQDVYHDFHVVVNGGAARGVGRAYAILGYLRKNGEFFGRRQLSGELGEHPGSYDEPGSVVRGKNEPRAYAFWQLGLTEGSRYDVRSFTVEIKRQRLMTIDPQASRSRTASDANTIAEPSGAPGPG